MPTLAHHPRGSNPAPRGDGRRNARAGQSLIESCIAITVTAFLLFGLLQLSQVLAAREILEHAAARGARAKTVGFNRWMVEKVVDVAAIPNAGRMVAPPYENIDPALRDHVANARPGSVWDHALATDPDSDQAALERARIPEYLAAENRARARFILDYADWDTIDHWATDVEATGDDSAGLPLTHLHVEQAYPLRMPMVRAFWGDNHRDLAGDAYLETHYPLYMVDLNW